MCQSSSEDNLPLQWLTSKQPSLSQGHAICSSRDWPPEQPPLSLSHAICSSSNWPPSSLLYHSVTQFPPQARSMRWREGMNVICMMITVVRKVQVRGDSQGEFWNIEINHVVKLHIIFPNYETVFQLLIWNSRNLIKFLRNSNILKSGSATLSTPHHIRIKFVINSEIKSQIFF